MIRNEQYQLVFKKKTKKEKKTSLYCTVEGTGVGVVKQDREAGGGGELGDAGAHLAGTHHPNDLHFSLHPFLSDLPQAAALSLWVKYITYLFTYRKQETLSSSSSSFYITYLFIYRKQETLSSSSSSFYITYLYTYKKQKTFSSSF